MSVFLQKTFLFCLAMGAAYCSFISPALLSSAPVASHSWQARDITTLSGQPPVSSPSSAKLLSPPSTPPALIPRGSSKFEEICSIMKVTVYQKEQLKNLADKRKFLLQGVSSNTSLTFLQKAQKIKEIHIDLDTVLRQILSPSQVTLFFAWRKVNREAMSGL